jgi:hypothetical protein
VRTVPWFEALGVGVLGWVTVALALGMVLGRISRRTDQGHDTEVISGRRSQYCLPPLTVGESRGTDKTHFRRAVRQ